MFDRLGHGRISRLFKENLRKTAPYQHRVNDYFWGARGALRQHFGPKARIPELFERRDRVYFALENQKLKWYAPAPYPHHDLLDAAAKVGRVEESIGYTFKHKLYCIEALKQTSGFTPFYFQGSVINTENNRRLALLGDKVLDLALSEIWFYTGNTTAEYSLMSTKTVSRVALNTQGLKINLGKNLILSETTTLGATLNQVAETFEAVLGAVYLDSGHDVEAVKRVISTVGLDRNKFLKRNDEAIAEKERKENAAQRWAEKIEREQEQKVIAAARRKAELQSKDHTADAVDQSKTTWTSLFSQFLYGVQPQAQLDEGTADSTKQKPVTSSSEAGKSHSGNLADRATTEMKSTTTIRDYWNQYTQKLLGRKNLSIKERRMEARMEAQKQREKRKLLQDQEKKERQRAREKEMALQKEKEQEIQKEREKQKEQEAMKKKLEAQEKKNLEEQRNRELEAQKKRDAEARKQQEVEAQKLQALEAQKLQALEAQKQKALEAQKQHEVEAQTQKDSKAQEEKELEAQTQKGPDVQEEKERVAQTQKEPDLQEDKELEAQEQKAVEAQGEKESEDQKHTELEVRKQNDGEQQIQKEQEEKEEQLTKKAKREKEWQQEQLKAGRQEDEPSLPAGFRKHAWDIANAKAATLKRRGKPCHIYALFQEQLAEIIIRQRQGNKRLERRAKLREQRRIKWNEDAPEASLPETTGEQTTAAPVTPREEEPVTAPVLKEEQIQPPKTQKPAKSVSTAQKKSKSNGEKTIKQMETELLQEHQRAWQQAGTGRSEPEPQEDGYAPLRRPLRTARTPRRSLAASIEELKMNGSWKSGEEGNSHEAEVQALPTADTVEVAMRADVVHEERASHRS